MRSGSRPTVFCRADAFCRSIITSLHAPLQDKLRKNVVVKGDKEKAVSELEAGRRTIVRDPDDPEQEANMLDSLYVGREDDLEDELRAAYAAVGREWGDAV